MGGNLEFDGDLLPCNGVDVLLGELDVTGKVLWKQVINDNGNQWATGITVDHTGNIVLTGAFEFSITLGNKTYATPNGVSSSFVARLATDLTYQWGRVLDGDPAIYPLALPIMAGIDESNNVLFAGGFTGSLDLGGTVLQANGEDIVVAKLGPTGAVLWAKRFGNSADQYATAMSVLPSGESIVTGVLKGLADFGTGQLAESGGGDVFVARFAP